MIDDLITIMIATSAPLSDCD